MTAALTAASAVGPSVNTPWFCSSTAGLGEPASVWTTTCPMSSPPIRAKPPHGMSPPNSSAMAVSTHGMGRPSAAKAVA
jgi:hypothetical protein